MNDHIVTFRKRYHLIINPASAGGKCGALAERVVSRLEQITHKDISFSITAGPADARKAASHAVGEACCNILVLGGDGTINEAVNGMIDAGAGPEQTLGIISCGSGNGLALSLGLPDDLESQIRCAVSGPRIAIDAGELSYRDSFGLTAVRYFINECQIGIGAEAVSRTTSRWKRAGGLLGYGVQALSLLFKQKPVQLGLIADGQPMKLESLGVSIGNGSTTAGGMHLTPDAVLNDGMLDLLVIKQQNLLGRLNGFAGIYRGRHTGMPGFVSSRFSSVSIEADRPVRIAADGELVGYLPCSISTIPGAIRVRSISEKAEHDYATLSVAAQEI